MFKNLIFVEFLPRPCSIATESEKEKVKILQTIKCQIYDRDHFTMIKK